MATCWNIYVQTLSQPNFDHNMEIHYLSVHEHEVEVATSTRKHWLVYGI